MRRLPSHTVEHDGVGLPDYLADLEARVAALEAGGMVPQASFTMNPTSGTAPLDVAFTDTTTGAPTAWAWDFGDGATSTAQNPSHTFAEGSYTVTLTASNAYGSTSTNSSLTVDPQPVSRYSDVVLADSPLAYWRLDEAAGSGAATAVDSSGNGRSLWIATTKPTFGEPAVPPAADGTSWKTGGTGHARSTPIKTAGEWNATLGNDFSAEAWVKTDATSVAGPIVTRHGDGGAFRMLAYADGSLGWATFSSSFREIKAPAGTLVANTIYHVVGTYDGTTARLYVNGTEVAAGPTAYSPYLDPPINVNYDNPGTGWQGWIDEVAIYGTALTAARIAEHYAAGTTG